MKNLSAIPRLSLSEAFTILITLVVCLACFTEAEVNLSNRQQENDKFSAKETPFDKNFPFTQQTSMMRGDDESQQKNFANLKHYPNSPLEKLIKRHSDYFDESDDSDLERESDGYGYDDDEYYHVNYKRNEDTAGSSDEKSDKESVGETNQNMLNSQKPFSTNRKDDSKELKTIEMLNFKEIHPKIGSEEEQNPLQNNPKPFSSNEIARKKQPSSDPMGSLKVIDLKENSAIDETMKERKEEAGAVMASSSDSKIAESKKGVKSTEEKDPVKLKESKLGDDSEKKEKEATLKEGKDAISAKNLKESSKSSEDKEKNVKLSDSAKLEENLEKMSSKSKDGESAKLVKEDKDGSRFTEKVSADVINPKEISQITNRASFVSNDYKDNFDAIKSIMGQGDEKNSEELNENEKNIGLTDYRDVRPGKEKQFSLRKTDKNDNFDFFNEQYNMAKVVQEAEKANPFMRVPASFELQNDHPSEFNKKRESWKDQGSKVQQQQQQLTQEQQANQQQQFTQEQLMRQQQPQMSYSFEPQTKSVCPSNFPSTNELENTDYHRNYLKSLKRYKVLTDNTKSIASDPLRLNSLGKSSFREKMDSQKKKRSKSKKRRSMLPTKMPEEKEKASEFKRNTCKIADGSSGDSQKCVVQPHDSSVKTAKEEMTFSDGKKSEGQPENNRRRRKSPKLEYEIKVINQNQQDSKNAQLSHFCGRIKKDVKAKLSPEDKYLKKYPYSQVSRDDLMRLNEITESEKKIKRKAPIWKRSDEKSAIRTRAAPSGYYSNRVKFGQKTLARNNEKTESDPSSIEINQPYHTQTPSASFQQENVGKNNFQRAWDGKQQSYKHDPIKRYDENSFLNKGNSLLLVKKGERTVKAFEEGSSSKAAEDEMDRDQLAKILSKDNEYVVLKRTEGNKFRKISETGAPSLQSDSSSTYSNKKSRYDEQISQGNLKSNGKQISFKNKGLQTRSSHSDKDDKKYLASFHSSNTKSNLRKTLDKFRDLADFFKDSEQESADNQFSAQEVKEGRDIVFSEDKLPDPIVISSDGMGKDDSLKQKPLNSIYSISTNFKNLDQQDKKGDSPTSNDSPKNMFTSEAKADNMDFSWEPALKSVFPEAKTINAMNKNGNEIIVLDFNRNQLKTEHALHVPSKMSSKTQSLNSMGSTSRLPVNNPTTKFLGDQKVQLVLGDVPSVLQISPKVASDKYKYQDKIYQVLNDQNGAYAVVTSEETQPQVSVPLQELTDLSSLLKSFIEKRPNELNSNLKVVTKKSLNGGQQNKMSENYNQFLQDLTELSDVSKNKKSKLSEKRNSKAQLTLPSSSFSELSTYSDANIKQLGNLLQNIMTKDNPLANDNSNFDSVSTEVSHNTAENQVPEQLYQNTAKYEVDPNLKRQGRWSSDEGKGKAYVHFDENEAADVPEDAKKEIESLFQDDRESKINENELWEELAAASDKVHRLRREGMGKRKLRKTIEDALSFKGRRDFGQSDNNSKNKRSSFLKDEASLAEEAKNEGSNKNEETKESSERDKSLESDYESNLTELFENLNANKNQKNPSETSWNRKKRNASHRRKRFSRRDVKNKVSKTEVQNTILKNLAEANYQSVYSPGIKRRLLSTNIEAEDADNYSDADEHDKNVLAKEPETKCVKNAVNKCVDPMIVEIFGAENSKEEKNRARRSLNTGFHSDFKREIDLDESMPNDFQNFLVTSLGGFGSQTRSDVIKRDDAFLDGKLSSLNNYNQIAESPSTGYDFSEDSALEKREVSSKENRKAQSYKNSVYFSRNGDSDSDLEEVFGTLARSEKKTRSEDKTSTKSKASEFTDEKLPTQIRIQITNASGKEKKSSKPIMDESETTSTDMENLPKEKEFFDKNKLNPLLAASKLQQLPKNKFSYNEYEENETRDIGGRNKPYRPYRRRKRKKKKYISEDAMKPIKDFISFDQKAIESLLKKQQRKSNANSNANANANANANSNANQNANALWSDQTTQKIPVSNHLPQVETVYNPTQGTNKAQLEANRLGKINSISSKNSVNVKNGLQGNEASSYDEGIMRSYFKPDKIKSDKGSLKEYEEMDWKPLPGRMKWSPEPDRDSQFGLNLPNSKTSNIEPSPSLLPNAEGSRYINPYTQNIYDQKMLQQPYNNYFYHPSQSIMKSHSLYDALKLKQELKSRNGLSKDHLNAKPFGKPYYFNDNSLFKPDEKDKSLNTFSTFPSPTDPTWNPLEHPLIKKPFPQMYKTKDFYSTGFKTQTPLDARLKNTLAAAKKFSKTLEESKPNTIDTTLPAQPTFPDTTKEADYLETLEDDYLDEDASKETQSDELFLKDHLKKKMKFHESPGYHQLLNYKSSDMDDSMNDEDEEFDDEYDENSEEDDLDDYSLLANTRTTADFEPSRNAHGSAKFQSAFHPSDILHSGDAFHSGDALHSSGALHPDDPAQLSDALLHPGDALHLDNSLHPSDPLHPDGALRFGDVLHPGDALSRLNFYYPQIKGNSFMQTKFNSNPDEKFELGPSPGDLKNELDSISGSSGLLKKANENANIFGKNLMKNLNGYGYEDPRSHINKVHDDKSIDNLYPSFKNKLTKRKLDWRAKLKRSHQYPLIGSRLFYAAKTEVSDAKDLNPLSSAYRTGKSRNSRYDHRRMSAGNLLNAEFTSPNNDFDNEWDENRINLGKRSISPEKESPYHKKDAEKTENEEDFEDVEENLENDGETISDDNILENVIGKYIMRKKIKPSAEENEASQNVNLQSHKITKRSVEEKLCCEEYPKILKKRLSSGHLTENNFRKYHKKNLNGKRHINELDSTFTTSPLIRSKKHVRQTRTKDNTEQSKRSALDLFKKITNKDRDSKKAENADGRTAGFEPLLSLSDKKYDSSIQDAKEALLLEEKKVPHDASQAETKSNIPELKAHCPNEGQQHLKAQLVERKKEKSKEAVKEQSSPAAQGPWKIELNDKYNLKESEHADKANRKSFKSLRDMEALPFKDDNENLKGFLVITRDKNVRAAKRNTADSLPTSGSFLREVGNSYRPKTGESRGIFKKQVQKRSLLSAKDQVKNNPEDAVQKSSDRNTESHFKYEDKNRALRDTKSLSEGDSKPQAPHVIQRNTKKNSFVTNDERKSGNSQFLLNENFINGKSVLRPSSDANIIRDSRHVNEETSEYLGQQIVDAILSHVSENPKFKELIAPGLSKRTATATTYSEGNDCRRALNEMDFSDQLQSFLQKFMLDLEKLAEKQVKKRMCHKIDKLSKQFLQSLLSVPVKNSKSNAYDTNNKTSSSQNGCEEVDTTEDPTTPSFMDVPETTQTSQKLYKLNDNVVNSLRKKQNLLLKLIDNYQNLSKVEKEALDVNYRYLLKELDQTNEKLASPTSQAFLVSVADPCENADCQSGSNKNTKSQAYENPKEVFCISNSQQNSQSGTPSPSSNKCMTDEEPSKPQSCQSQSSQTQTSSPCSQSQTTESTCSTPSTTPQPLPVLYFHEIQNPSTSEKPPSTTPSSFEKVHPANISELCAQNQAKNSGAQNKAKNSQTQCQQNQNSQSQCQQNQNSQSQYPQNQNSQMPCQQNQNSQMPCQQNQNSQMPCQQNQNSQMPCQQNQNSQMPCQQNQNSQMPCQQNQNSQMPSQQNQNSQSQYPQNQNSQSQYPQNQNSQSQYPQNQNSQSQYPQNQNSQMQCQQNENSQMRCQQNENSQSQNATKTCPKPCQNFEETTETPESFDLLPSQFTATPPNEQLEESVRTKQSLPKDDSLKKAVDKKIANLDLEDNTYHPYIKPTELHKLSLGDAAGLQLSLKYRGPWVSNLDFAKTLSTPTITEPNIQLNENQPFKNNVDFEMDVPFVEDFKNPRSLIAPNSEYFTSVNRQKSKYYYSKPVFPYHLDKKFYTPKVRPFGNFDSSDHPKELHDKDNLFMGKPPPTKKMSQAGSRIVARPSHQRKRLRKFNSLKYQLGKKRKRVISQFLFRHPKKLKPPLRSKQTAKKV